MTDIIRRMGITGMSVVPGGRGAGGNPVTTGIIGRIDIITGRIGAITTGELVPVEPIAPRRHRCHLIPGAVITRADVEHVPAPTFAPFTRGGRGKFVPAR